MQKIIGICSGLFVLTSVIPYLVGVIRGTIEPNLTSWFLWSFISFALLVTYKSNGADNNIWPVFFGFTNPVLVTIAMLWKGKFKKPKTLEYVCGGISMTALILWWFVRDEKETFLAELALCLSIVADLCAFIPTMRYVRRNPEKDLPLAWTLFAIGYALALGALPVITFASVVLPVYMAIASSLVALPLIAYRIKNKIPINKWIW